MASRYASPRQKAADDMDRRLYDFADRAYGFAEADERWADVYQHLERARSALRPLMHPDDEKTAYAADNA